MNNELKGGLRGCQNPRLNPPTWKPFRTPSLILWQKKGCKKPLIRSNIQSYKRPPTPYYKHILPQNHDNKRGLDTLLFMVN